MRYLSPLRYPGGKARLAPLLERIIRASGCKGCQYIEPYAGGAGAALALLRNDTVSSIHINDASPAIAAFWRSVLEMNAELCDRVTNATLDVDTWRAQRSILAQGSTASILDLGFAAFYLNRTNRSGIIGSGGVIGGLAQAGKWRMDARFDRDRLVERIQWIGDHRERVRVTDYDALTLLADLDDFTDIFVYLDPPYYRKADRLYDHWYRPEDHAIVCGLVRRLSQPWVVSYDDCPEIRQLYDGIRSCELSLTYSAARSYRGAEILFFSPSLTD